MKKHCSLLILLFILVSNFLSLGLRILPVIGDTYVEGVISQDTLWTLVDSPFILSDNVTVASAATLTVEPGVEVKFGGYFSLIINGKLMAIGTEDRKITFTADDPTHAVVWDTIKFDSSESSTLANCIIEYGTNATTLVNGLLEVQNSSIRYNSACGFAVNGGILNVRNSDLNNNRAEAVAIAAATSVLVEDCAIEENGNGIHIVGGDQLYLHTNVIRNNTDGLKLEGQLTGTLDARQNNILSNAGNGVFINSEALGTTIIVENNVSSNHYGFFVAANISTYITHNYISNNTVGIYYTGGASHQAEFNDIYDNGMGIDVDSLSSAIVNATHNYWGHRTGAQHDSLNPKGKANPVGGDGINLLLVPFLTLSFTHINSLPTAAVWTDKTVVAPYQTITFVGTDSQDEGRVEEYFFDFDDTTNSGWTTLSLYNHSYSSVGTYSPNLVVGDDFGGKSTAASTTVNVVDLTPLQASVTLEKSIVPYNGEVTVTVYASSIAGPVADATINLFAVRGGSFEPQSGLTNINGYFTSTFTAPNVSEPTDIRIIARASLNGYADGSDYKYVRTLPPLTVELWPTSAAIWSNETTTVNVQVTNDFSEPVEGANLTASCNDGTVSPLSAITDTGGHAVFQYNAPVTLLQLIATVTVNAVKTEYADSQGAANITVDPQRLSVEVIVNPQTVLSESNTAIMVRVKFDSVPIPNAIVTINSDAGGNFSATTQSTNEEGLTNFLLIAPQTTQPEGLNATITATAMKTGYIDGENQTTLTVTPKVLSVEISSGSAKPYSEGRLNLTVSVTYGNETLADANVSITATSGTFTEDTGVTDVSGQANFTIRLPMVYEVSVINVSATATKTGYLGNSTEGQITVSLRTFSIQLTPTAVEAGGTEAVTARITCKEDSTQVEGATVTISYAYGEQVTNITDLSGSCQATLNIPQEQISVVNLTVTLTRDGYEPRQLTMQLNVVWHEAGFPTLTLIIVLIPIIVAIVVGLLIKLKVIQVSLKGEDEAIE